MTPKDLIELASLYAIGALDERDSLLVEDCAENSEEFKSELAQLQIAALAISYGSEQCALPSGLKERLMQKINSEHPIEKLIEKPIVETDIFKQLSFQIKADRQNWQPHPENVDGVSISTLYANTTTNKFSGLVRCEVGAIYPAHRHAEDEEIFILEGDLIIDGKSFDKGDYIYSAPNSLHSPISNRNGCLFFVRTSLNDYFV